MGRADRRLAVRRRRGAARPGRSSRASGAAEIFDSLHDRLLSLDDDVEVWPGHLGGSLCGSSAIENTTSSTIGLERHHNPALRIRASSRSWTQRSRESATALPSGAHRGAEPRAARRGARHADAADAASRRGGDRRGRDPGGRADERAVRRGPHPWGDQRLRLRHGLRHQGGTGGRPGRRADRRRRLRWLRAGGGRAAGVGGPARPGLPGGRHDRLALGGATREAHRVDRSRCAREASRRDERGPGPRCPRRRRVRRGAHSRLRPRPVRRPDRAAGRAAARPRDRCRVQRRQAQRPRCLTAAARGLRGRRPRRTRRAWAPGSAAATPVGEGRRPPRARRVALSARASCRG